MLLAEFMFLVNFSLAIPILQKQQMPVSEANLGGGGMLHPGKK